MRRTLAGMRNQKMVKIVVWAVVLGMVLTGIAGALSVLS